MSIVKEKYTDLLLQVDPGFKNDLESHLIFMGKESNIHGVFSAFSDYVGDRLEGGDYSELLIVLNEMENLLQDKDTDETIKNAVCTCFLENLINRFTEDHETLTKFIPLLGPESKKYCKAWDEFTGVETLGLWSSEKPNYAVRNQFKDEEVIKMIAAIKNNRYENSEEMEKAVDSLEISIPGISRLIFYDNRNLTPAQILAEAKLVFKR